MAQQTTYATVDDILAILRNPAVEDKQQELKKLKTEKNSDAYTLLQSLLGQGTVLKYKKQIPEQYRPDKQEIQKQSDYIPRRKHQALYNDNGSIALKDDGSVSFASNIFNNLHMSGDNTTAVNTEYEIKTNAYSLEADDIIINNHKLNNKLYELADFKKVLNTYDGTPHVAGGLTMLGTVLVRAWEPNLKRYVLVRRQVNIPVFSPSLGGPEVNPGIGISPAMDFVKSVMDKIPLAGQSLSNLYDSIKSYRDEAIAKQEAKAAAEYEKIKQEHASLQATDMTTLTGQYGGGSAGGAGSSRSWNITGDGSPSAVVDNASQFPDGYQWMDPTGVNTDPRNQCASFASQMMKKAGIDIDVVINGDVLAGQFKSVGAYHRAGDGYQPQSGDLIDWAHHVGIYAGNGEYIARNSSGGVKRGSMNGMESYFGTLWGFGSVAELQKAKGHKT